MGKNRMSKRVLITGGTRGIGKALVQRFAGNGWQVVFCYENSVEQAEQLAKEYPNVLPIRCNVADETQVQELFTQVGKIDALVCNAGIALPQQLLTDTSFEDYKRVMSVNMDGTFLCCKQAAKTMVANHSGSIVTVSSMWGEIGGSCEVAYSASKGAIIAFTKALAKELGPAGVRVNCVSPGVIETEMNGHLSDDDKLALKEETPLMQLGTPEDVANAVAFLCSEQASFITGQVIGINGGMVI